MSKIFKSVSCKFNSKDGYSSFIVQNLPLKQFHPLPDFTLNRVPSLDIIQVVAAVWRGIVALWL